MFMDGMIYATVAKNLANGSGTIWDLHLTDFVSPHYHDQPPLTIWLTAGLFKLIGNSIYTERLYSLLMLLLNLILLRAIWKTIFRNTETSHLWFLPVLLWIIPPACFWSYTNNMEENTVSVFSLLAFYFLSNIIFQKKNIVTFSILAGLSIFLAGMSKGIQSTFLLASPFFFFIMGKSDRTLSIKIILITWATFLVLSVLLFTYEPARNYFKEYYTTRLVSTFNNPETATTSNRFYLLWRLTMEEISPILLCILILTVKRPEKSAFKKQFKVAGVFFLIALSATLPLLITNEQRRFYLVPAYPYYALGFAYLVYPSLQTLLQKANKRTTTFIYSVTMVILFSTAYLTAIYLNTPKRDAYLIYDVKSAMNFIGNEKQIGIEKELYTDWLLHLTFQRYYGVSLNPDSAAGLKYLLVQKNSQAMPMNFQEIDAGLEEFRLGKRRN